MVSPPPFLEEVGGGMLAIGTEQGRVARVSAARAAGRQAVALDLVPRSGHTPTGSRAIC
jgi:hypothetical protein